MKNYNLNNFIISENKLKKNSGKIIAARSKEAIPKSSQVDEAANKKLDCEICGIFLSSESQKQEHLTGSKHLSKVKGKTDVQGKGDLGNDEHLKKLSNSSNNLKVLPNIAKGQKPDTTKLENAQMASGSFSPMSGAIPKSKNLTKKLKIHQTPDLNLTQPPGPINTTLQSVSKNPKDNVVCKDLYTVALDKNGKGKCELCQVILSSAKIAKDHIDGKKHKSNLQALNLPT